jgi:hypothetical protein
MPPQNDVDSALKRSFRVSCLSSASDSLRSPSRFLTVCPPSLLYDLPASVLPPLSHHHRFTHRYHFKQLIPPTPAALIVFLLQPLHQVCQYSIRVCLITPALFAYTLLTKRLLPHLPIENAAHPHVHFIFHQVCDC